MISATASQPEGLAPCVPWEAFKHAHHTVGALSMHVASLGAGAAGQPPIFMLHGFPDLWCIWAKVMVALPDHACFAPDQRGYNLTTRPGDVQDYSPNHLLGDIVGLVDAFGAGNPVILAGHDWGGVLAAWFAARHPDKVARLILVNTSHPKPLQEALWTDPNQRAASAYMNDLRSGVSQTAWLAQGTQALFESWTGPYRQSGKMDDFEACLYKAAWADPGAWTAMTDWYRASPFELSPRPVGQDWTTGQAWTVTAPTLLIWGEDDGLFTPRLRESQADWFADLTHVGLPGIGHNPLRDAPDAVAHAIRLFLKQD